MKLITKTETAVCVYYGLEEHSFVDGNLVVGDAIFTGLGEGDVTIYSSPEVPSDFHVMKYLYDGTEFTVAGYYHLFCNEMRQTRNNMIRETDWWASSDLTMTQSQTEYRQGLRDVPQQEGFPYSIIWPIYDDPKDTTDYSRP